MAAACNPVVAAAVMSQIVGKPVRLQYMRWDEHGWDKFGATHLIDMRGGIDAQRQDRRLRVHPVLAGRHGERSITDAAARGARTRRNSGWRARSKPPPTGCSTSFPNWRVIWKTLPLYGGYFPTGAMRASQSAQTTFGTEVFADELAYAAKMDPIAFRRLNVRKTQLNGSVQAGAVPVHVELQGTLPRRAGRGREGLQLAAAGGGLEPLRRQHRHRPRGLVRPARVAGHVLGARSSRSR